ncbi:MAG: hypothetical protein DHS20C18_41390 [Saprospiraceae bacterium]|nr:MAG: hypothetical protein DHS20C18_41390 [Saprospiraceae bacterium]
MLKKLLIFSLTILSAQMVWTQNQDFIRYVEKYKDIAIQEMERAGIPASIKLAQGILESNAGKSELARKGNNHFGIKCGNDWKGKKVFRKDDDYNEEGQLVESCFRSYKSVDACYVAHSEFLRDPKKAYRYGFLFRLNPRDYKRWAIGLKQAGYATSATYSEKLIDLIELYELHKYDDMSTIDLETPASEIVAGILTNNDVKYVRSESNETLADIARRTDVALRNLLKYNELSTDANQKLAEGEQIYIQPKRNAYRGKEQYHYVEKGQNMLYISQRYGVKVSKLYHRNRMPDNTQPAPNERIKLRGCKVKTSPKLMRDYKESDEPPMPELILDETDEGEMEMETEPETPIEPEIPITTPKPPVLEPGKKPEFPESKPKDPSTIPEKIEVDPLPTEKPKPPVTTPPPPKPETPNPDVPINNEPDFPETPIPEVENPVTPTPTPPATTETFHVVEKGDTLYNISRRYNTTVDLIKSLNGLTDNTIRLGMRLKVK